MQQTEYEKRHARAETAFQNALRAVQSAEAALRAGEEQTAARRAEQARVQIRIGRRAKTFPHNTLYLPKFWKEGNYAERERQIEERILAVQAAQAGKPQGLSYHPSKPAK